MSTQILTSKSKIIDSHRNKDQNPAQDTRGSKGKPLIPTESYHDDEVEFGEIRVPYSSQSTIIEDSGTASGLYISVGAENVR